MRLDLLSESLYQQLLAYPGTLGDMLRVVAPGGWVILDEIQRLPNLLNEVHRFIEEKGLRFALCGSSARKLKRAGVNLLAGRAVRRAMHPFVPAELGPEFQLEDALRYGLLPIVQHAAIRQEVLTAYVQMYLKEEIQAEALVRNLSGFARFLPVAAVCHGQAVNVANIARECGVSRTTVAGYMEILEETLLGFTLPAYEAKLRVRERKHPKFYWCDPGLVRAMTRRSGEVSSEERGALFEGLVVQLLRAYRDYDGLCDDLAYWSAGNRSSVEVDVILSRGDQRIAIEVKSGRHFDLSWCKGLRAVGALPGVARRLVVYPTGPVLRTEDGIDVWPFDRFAEALARHELRP